MCFEKNVFSKTLRCMLSRKIIFRIFRNRKFSTFENFHFPVFLKPKILIFFIKIYFSKIELRKKWNTQFFTLFFLRKDFLLNPKEKEIFLISNLPIKELPPQELLTLDDLIGDGENSEDAEFHDLAAAVIQECSGVWSNLIYNLIQMKNQDFENFVGTGLLYIYINNKTCF